MAAQFPLVYLDSQVYELVRSRTVAGGLGEMKTDANNIENLLAISNICDYDVEKKGLL